MPLPRRSADSPEESPSTDTHVPGPRRSLPSREPAWLSIVIVPLVIVLSIVLALGLRWYLTSGDGVPIPEPPSTPTTAPSTPSPSPEPRQVIELNDTTFTAPASWELVSDELIEGERRAVRLTDPDSDVRLQATTLGLTPESLEETCQTLTSLQSEAFSGATPAPLAPISAPEGDQGLSCGFSGVRETDQIPNTVTFILLRRADDGHLLMLRVTAPDSEPVLSPARAELAAMQCEASTAFGVRLPLC